MYLSIIMLSLIGLVVLSSLRRKIGVNNIHSNKKLSVTIASLTAILSYVLLNVNLLTLTDLGSLNTLLGLIVNHMYLLQCVLICYLIVTLWKVKLSLNDIDLYIFCYAETYFVLFVANLYIRPLLNGAILNIGLPYFTTIIIIIIGNILLSKILYCISKLLREYFYYDFRDFVFIIYSYMELGLFLLATPSPGIVFMTSSWQRKMMARQDKYQYLAERYLDKWSKYRYYSRRLHTMAPLMNRSGKGGLHDSFIESANTFEEEAELLHEQALFFWLQSGYLERFTRLGHSSRIRVWERFPHLPDTEGRIQDGIAVRDAFVGVIL